MISFTINGRTVSHEGDDSQPLLWYLREEAGLKGTKYGCGIGLCGACTVHVNGRARRSCSVRLRSLAEGDAVVTIEGLARDGSLHPVQEAWIRADVAQCGYCQPGWIMATVAFLADHLAPTDEEIDRGLSNLCRCGTYNRIRAAIREAAQTLRPGR
jgi:isoquinoline 1-oxidoreductase alpha subunit